MASKKYYWLKLKDDFFTTREIKKLRRIAGGDTYTIIYLKMQLLSIKKEGLLLYEGTEQNLTEQLALELDEDEDNVKMTIAFLQANKLIEQLSEDEYLLNRVPESIGSETGAAERMRKMREKRNIVTPQLPEVTKNYTEIEIERRDRDREEIEEKTPNSLLNSSEFKEIAQLYQQIIGQANSLTAEWIEGHLEEYGFEWLKNALIVAEEQGKRNKSYVNGILKNWKTEGGMKKGDGASGANNGDNSNSKGKGGKEEIDWAERAGVPSF